MTNKMYLPKLTRKLLSKVSTLWPLKVLLNETEFKSDRDFETLSAKQTFTNIYEEGVWGKSADQQERFFSGSGSHDPVIVEPYINAVEGFLNSFKEKPDVVDLGCGDFFVGSKLRLFCNNYIACDIVEPVIEFNRIKYKDDGVEFRVLDLTQDELPFGKIVFIRQVLQHLSNKQIHGAISKISAKYQYLVLTEHLPSSTTFVPNHDKAHGPEIRLSRNTGVVLTHPPFNLKALESVCFCEIPEYGGLIRTDMYKLS